MYTLYRKQGNNISRYYIALGLDKRIVPHLTNHTKEKQIYDITDSSDCLETLTAITEDKYSYNNRYLKKDSYSEVNLARMILGIDFTEEELELFLEKVRRFNESPAFHVDPDFFEDSLTFLAYVQPFLNVDKPSVFDIEKLESIADFDQPGFSKQAQDILQRIPIAETNEQILETVDFKVLTLAKRPNRKFNI